MIRFRFCAVSLLVLVFSFHANSKPLPRDWETQAFLHALFNQLSTVTDFDFSGQASPPSCSGSVVSFGQNENSKAILMTNGHCVGMLSVPPETIFRNRNYAVNVRLFKDQQHTITVRSNKILYGTISTNDIALVELDTTYKNLADKGIRARRVSTTPVTVGTQIIMPSGYFRTVSACPILAIVPFIHEDVYRNTNAYKYRDCDSIHGTSGSPLINAATGEVIGMNYTGNDDGERCTFNNPCEVDEAGVVTVDHGASYGDPVHQIYTCLNAQKELDLDQPGCMLPH